MSRTYQPIETVRIGFAGLGTRGTRAIKRFLHLDGVEIKALCDLSPTNIESIKDIIGRKKSDTIATYTGIDGWKSLCDNPDIDLIYICTDWLSHTPISLYAMQCGKDVAVEVPATTTIDECWQLVECVERTSQRFIMLENCCYDLFELTTLNMVKHGLLGEIVHGEGGYIHDLRELIFADNQNGGFYNFWHKKFNTMHTGNTYPTHGLGPICQAMNINRGDRMQLLVSVSTGQKQLTDYTQEVFGGESDEAKTNYLLGDYNTTIIKTEKNHTILLKQSMSMPQPYSRGYVLNGTRGFVQKYPVQLVSLIDNPNQYLDADALKDLYKTYQHPFIDEIGQKAIEVCAERARDYIMDYRLIYCMQHGLPFDMDVYDAVSWSSIIELSEQSIRNQYSPIQIPDFTRGRWSNLK